MILNKKSRTEKVTNPEFCTKFALLPKRLSTGELVWLQTYYVCTFYVYDHLIELQIDDDGEMLSICPSGSEVIQSDIVKYTVTTATMEQYKKCHEQILLIIEEDKIVNKLCYM